MIVSPANKYSGIPVLEELINRASCQREIVEALKNFEPNKGGVDSFTNSGLQCEEAWTDPATLTTSIFLALRSRRDMDALIMSCGDYASTSVPAAIPGNVENMSRKALAEIIARELLNDARAVGFALEFQYDKNARAKGYQLRIMRLNERDKTRNDILKEAQVELKAKLLSFKEELKATKSESDPIGYSEYIAKENKIRQESAWKPSYIARYYHA